MVVVVVAMVMVAMVVVVIVMMMIVVLVQERKHTGGSCSGHCDVTTAQRPVNAPAHHECSESRPRHDYQHSYSFHRLQRIS